MTRPHAEFSDTRYLVHKFNRYRHGRLQVCERCGTKRRHRPSGWEWIPPGGTWTSNSPICARKEPKP